MNIKLIKRILFFSILFTATSLKPAHKKPQRHIQKKPQHHIQKKPQHHGSSGGGVSPMAIPTRIIQPSTVTTQPQVITPNTSSVIQPTPIMPTATPAPMIQPSSVTTPQVITPNTSSVIQPTPIMPTATPTPMIQPSSVTTPQVITPNTSSVIQPTPIMPTATPVVTTQLSSIPTQTSTVTTSNIAPAVTTQPQLITPNTSSVTQPTPVIPTTTPTPIIQPSSVTTQPQVITPNTSSVIQPAPVMPTATPTTTTQPSTTPTSTVTTTSITPTAPTTSTQTPINNTNTSVVQPPLSALQYTQASQMIADIIVLKQNYQILSKNLTDIIKNIVINGSNIPSNYIYNDPVFDPTKQIINGNGTYTNATPPAQTTINPYTGNLITYTDMNLLSRIRKSYLNSIELIIFIVSNINANQLNVYNIKHYLSATQVNTLSAQGNQAYRFNALNPLWQTSINYISQGQLINPQPISTDLATDITTLIKNHAILSNTLATSIKNKLINNGSTSGQSTYTYKPNDPVFNPIKQIMNGNGTYANAISTTINPFTTNPIATADISALKEIKEMYLNTIYLMLFALGDIETCSINEGILSQYLSTSTFSALKGKSYTLAYQFNDIKPLWQSSINYMVQGLLTI